MNTSWKKIIAVSLQNQCPKKYHKLLIGDFRYKFIPFTTFEVKNIAAPYNIQKLAGNFRVETEQSINQLPYYKGKIVKKFSQPTNRNKTKMKSNLI